jgi:hypothetical protein
MRYLKGSPHHECCPPEWRNTPDMTGSFELDAVIARNTNKDIPSRLAFYLEQENAYSARTAYNGYHNYHGDS